MAADLGGTEMEAALRSVFALGGTEAAADVLLITDGEIWNADSLVAAARAAGQRVFTVGIGAAPAEGVLRRLAETTGGACEFVAPDEDAEAGDPAHVRAVAESPRGSAADVAWPGAPVGSRHRRAASSAARRFTSFAGFAAAPAGDVAIRLVPAGGGEPLAARRNVARGGRSGRYAGADGRREAHRDRRRGVAARARVAISVVDRLPPTSSSSTSGRKARRRVDLPRAAARWRRCTRRDGAGWAVSRRREM